MMIVCLSSRVGVPFIMLLAIDVSNTGIKLGLYEGRVMRARWRIATVREKTTDEYAMLLTSL